ncbi:MAG: enoyl-CoA hydratase/isomerase family protein [Nannocystaceae bacterium]|nr:enoyl-CoA hydratase/isomerase family protein [bacterium]
MDLSALEGLHPSYDADRQLLTLELDHGKANEMGTVQLDAFEALCTLIEEDDSVRTLVTTSRRLSKKGKPIFIAGANVTERVDWDPDRVKAHVIRQRTLMVRLRHLPIFNIAIPSGVTLGWGTEYLLTADYTVATAAASFALPETGLGILPGARGTAELALLVGPAHAVRLCATGESIDAAEAARIGLVQEVVDDVDAGVARARALATLVSRKSPTAIAAYKSAMLEGLGQPETVRLDAERRAYELTVQVGDASTGRKHFADIRQGKVPPWAPRATRPAETKGEG